MRGVPVLASASGYYPRSGMLPLARSSGYSNLRPQFAEIMPGFYDYNGWLFTTRSSRVELPQGLLTNRYVLLFER
jgi:hypothetical protein